MRQRVRLNGIWQRPKESDAAEAGARAGPASLPPSSSPSGDRAAGPACRRRRRPRGAGARRDAGLAEAGPKIPPGPESPKIPPGPESLKIPPGPESDAGLAEAGPKIPPGPESLKFRPGRRAMQGSPEPDLKFRPGRRAFPCDGSCSLATPARSAAKGCRPVWPAAASLAPQVPEGHVPPVAVIALPVWCLCARARAACEGAFSRVCRARVCTRAPLRALVLSGPIPSGPFPLVLMPSGRKSESALRGGIGALGRGGGGGGGGGGGRGGGTLSSAKRRWISCTSQTCPSAPSATVCSVDSRRLRATSRYPAEAAAR